MLSSQWKDAKIFILYDFQRYRIRGDVKHLFGIGVITVGYGEIHLAIQMIRIVNEGNLAIVQTALGETGYGGVWMKFRFDSSAGKMSYNESQLLRWGIVILCG